MVFSTLHNILCDAFGESKKGVTDEGQSQFNCPCCAHEKGIISGGDGKYNLEVNFKKGKFNCWSCGMSNGTKGSITFLLKKWSQPDMVRRYKQEKQNIYNSMLYTISNKKELDEWMFDDMELELPNDFNNFNSNNSWFENECYKYLSSRRIDKNIIDKFNIGYTSSKSDPWWYNRRVVIPSYDQYDCLNYWVARDFTGKAQYKYCNPDIEKTNIIFNEKLINWDDDIILVEGAFDHIVTPNSIPLLGKVLKKDSYLFSSLQLKSNGKIIIFLDGDAYKNVIDIYRILNTNNLYDRIRYVPCPPDLDPAKIYELYGSKGICRYLKGVKKIHELELLKF